MVFYNSQTWRQSCLQRSGWGLLGNTEKRPLWSTSIHVLLTYMLFSQNTTIAAESRRCRRAAEETRAATCSFHPASSVFRTLQLILKRTIILPDKSANIFVKSSCRMSASHKLNYPASGSIQCLQQTFFCGSWVGPRALLLLCLTLPVYAIYIRSTPVWGKENVYTYGWDFGCGLKSKRYIYWSFKVISTCWKGERVLKKDQSLHAATAN